MEKPIFAYMSKTVRVKVRDSGKVVTMSEASANRLVSIHKNGEYQILEPPKVEVLTLPPLQPEKKSVAVAEDEPAKQVITAEEKQAHVEEKRKPGRPKQAA